MRMLSSARRGVPEGAEISRKRNVPQVLPISVEKGLLFLGLLRWGNNNRRIFEILPQQQRQKRPRNRLKITSEVFGRFAAEYLKLCIETSHSLARLPGMPLPSWIDHGAGHPLCLVAPNTMALRGGISALPTGSFRDARGLSVAERRLRQA
jgi:hypothetical protein